MTQITKSIFLTTILLFIGQCFASEYDFKFNPTGKYKSKGHDMDVVMDGDQIAAKIKVFSKGRCVGEMIGNGRFLTRTTESSEVDFTATTGDDEICTVNVKFDKDGQAVIDQSQSCVWFHGAACQFTGVARRSGPPVANFNKLQKDMKPTTFIESSPSGARIIADGEYLGRTPLSVSLEGKTFIRAMPTGNGCVQSEMIHRKTPKRMFFDTGLCPMGNDFNVNIN